MTIRTYILIVTLKVSQLNAPTVSPKDREWLNGFFKK